MRWLMFRLTLFCLVLGVSSPAWATTYYVDPTGNNANPGTSASPFLTIQKCVDTVVAGDTCTVANGTYTDTNGDGVVVYITSAAPNGTAGSPITIKSTNPLGAVISLPSCCVPNNGFRLSKDYYVIEGFAITGGTSVTAATTGIAVPAGAHNTIRKNWFHDIGRTVCTANANAFGGMLIDGSASAVTIENNLFNTIGRLRIGESGCGTAPGSVNLDHGLYVKDGADHIIHRNIFYDINRGYPIHFFGGTTIRVNVLNNTFAGKTQATSPKAQILIANAWSGASNIKNNIFYVPHTAPFELYQTLTGSGTINFDYNLTDSADADWFVAAVPSQAVDGGHNLNNTSPGFVNAACTQADGGCEAHDFNLAAGSAAINAGTDVGLPFNGTAPDIGAFESGGAPADVTPPAAPTRVQIQ